MTVGEKIKRLRKQAALTQTELGAKLGVQKNAVSKWECGRVEDIPASKIMAMASLFGVPPSYLIDDEAETPRCLILKSAPGEKIRSARRKKRLTMQQLSVAASVSIPRLNAIELVISEPTLAEMDRIAAALSVPLSTFADDHLIWRIEHSDIVPTRPDVGVEGDTGFDSDEQQWEEDYFQEHLLTLCDEMNNDGQNAILDRVAEMTEIERYRKFRFDEPDF